MKNLLAHVYNMVLVGTMGGLSKLTKVCMITS